MEKKKLLKHIDFLNKKRTRLIFSLIQDKPMINATTVIAYRRCGKQKCRCRSGDKHGPYILLSFNNQGIQRQVMVRRSDIPWVTKKTRRYKYFQRTLSEIRKINREIDKILLMIRTSNTESYR